MEFSEKTLKPILETAYLTAGNVHRYRAILRFFYIQYEKITYWMNEEEVYEEMASHPEFSGYTQEQCRQDLNALVEWNNLMPIQDTKKAVSVEAFKNKQFRYQLTEYTVEIERMALKLENLFVEGASLEPTLLERIRTELSKLEDIADEKTSNAAAYGWWNGLNSDFIRLNQNYQDYMRQLSSARAEELMKSREFLIYKDKLIEYLRSFVKGLQSHVPVIEKRLLGTTSDVSESIFAKVHAYELSIPRLDGEVTGEELYDKIAGRWQSLYNWFVERGDAQSEASRLFDMTNESIRKITRYAAQISEQITGGANRKEEYRQLAKIFAGCGSLKEAHKLAAVVFGVKKPLHLKGTFLRETDSINSGVFEELPETVSLVPRLRGIHETFARSPIRDRTQEKEQLKKELDEKRQREKKLLESCIRDNRLCFAQLGVVEPAARSVMLRWLSRAMGTKDGRAKTEDGRIYRVVNRNEKSTCLLKCSDGSFEMPAFILEFTPEENA